MIIKNPKNWSLLDHLILAFTITLLGVITVTSIWAHSQEQALLKKHFEKQVEKTFSAIAVTILDAAITEDRAVLSNIVSRVIEQNPDIEFLVIKNEQGNILANGTSNKDTRQDLAVFKKKLNFMGESFGEMEIHWSITSINNTAKTHVIQLEKIITSSLIIMATFIGLWLNFLLVKPVHKISHFLKKIQNNESASTKLKIKYPQEFSSLSQVLNDLSELLCLQKTRQNELKSDIEQHVLELEYQANHDSLTGLWNRKAFEQRLNYLLAQHENPNAHHALIYIDIDQFKIVNDTCGHIAGDHLLKQLAGQMELQVRKDDFLARIGGDEFALLLQHCQIEGAQVVANKILDTIKNFRFTWNEHIFNVGASLGIAPVYLGDATPESVVTHADIACYMAKELGRNRIEVFQEDQHELHTRRKEVHLASEIQKAIQKDQLILYFQEIKPVNQKTQTDRHFEILVRLLDSNGKFLSPGSFLPVAERFNLMAKVDRYIIKKTLSFLSAPQLHIDQVKTCSINISGQSLSDEGFFDFLLNEVSTLSFPHEKLCFEITETVAISNIAKVKQLITALKQQGCQFSLDDFGAGMSSFAYLKHLPVDYIKIDGMFVKNMDVNEADQIIVAAIHNIAQSLGKRTVAEFVENEKQFEILQYIGVDFAQGFGIAKPKPIEELGLEKKSEMADFRKQHFSFLAGSN